MFGEHNLKTGDVVTTDGVFGCISSLIPLWLAAIPTGLQPNDDPRKAWADADADFDITDI